ncbi:MAG: hypothetical protein QOI18_1575 [Solirubrobacteraceae bacterium]|nr:hypothetical protein [Solirubrobacteraceae bacterium]
MRGGRPLKRWRYVGVFSEQLMACAAIVQVGPARQSFWALYLRAEDQLRERTRLLPRRSALRLDAGTAGGGDGDGPRAGRLRICDAGVELDLSLAEERGFAARCPHGSQEVWTRKQAGIAAGGTLALDGAAPRQVRARAVIDDTAGYHARHTEWWWTAGVGQSADGRALAWNLVSGVNDPPSGSERAVWIDGEPHETPAVQFTEDLRRIDCVDGSTLRFHAEAERSHDANMIVVKSHYRAPFGAFSGSLPGGLALAHGLGVVEHHRALW